MGKGVGVGVGEASRGNAEGGRRGGQGELV